MELNESRKNLEACLDEDQRKSYFAILRRWFAFKSPITKQQFDSEVRELLATEEQIRCHNYFMLALLSRRPSTRAKINTERGVFECADYGDYVQSATPAFADHENRSAASELFMPDSGFMSTKIALAAWENGLNGAEDAVTEVMVNACQVFVKNIITAMISRRRSYKIRDGKFQYGFNLPIPDPFIRNYHNVIDPSQESNIELVENEDVLIPRAKPSLENVEQQAAFAYSCAPRKRKFDRTNGANVLSVKLLYETIRENPKILGLYELQSVNLLKLSLQLDND